MISIKELIGQDNDEDFVIVVKDFISQPGVSEQFVDHGSHEHQLSKNESHVTQKTVHKEEGTDHISEDHGYLTDHDGIEDYTSHRNASFTINRDWYSRINGLTKMDKKSKPRRKQLRKLNLRILLLNSRVTKLLIKRMLFLLTNSAMNFPIRKLLNI